MFEPLSQRHTLPTLPDRALPSSRTAPRQLLEQPVRPRRSSAQATNQRIAAAAKDDLRRSDLPLALTAMQLQSLASNVSTVSQVQEQQPRALFARSSLDGLSLPQRT